MNVCPICDSDSIANLKQVNKWDLLQCKHCRLIWVPTVDSKVLEEFYSSEYFHSSIGYADYQGDESNIRSDARWLLRQIPRSSSAQKKLLDVGCAYGFLLDEARKSGWQVNGVELCEGAVKFVREKWKIEAVRGLLKDARYPDNFFDAVTLIGTIEHLKNPMDTLSEIHRVLRPEGCLIITTVDTAQFPWLYCLKPPEHLYYFSHGNLSRALKHRGFQVERQERYWSKYNLRNYMVRALRTISPIPENSLIERWTPQWPILLPTNEMFLLARKAG